MLSKAKKCDIQQQSNIYVGFLICTDPESHHDGCSINMLSVATMLSKSWDESVYATHIV